MVETVMFTFTGSFRPEGFAGFARDRARRLALASVIRRSSRSEIVVMVRGQPDLIGAFEMACSLGPPDALVHDVVMRPIERSDPMLP